MDFGTMLRFMRQNHDNGVGPARLTSDVLDKLGAFYSDCIGAPSSVVGGLESQNPLPAVKEGSLRCLDSLIAQAQEFRETIAAIPSRDQLPPPPPPPDPAAEMRETLGAIRAALEKIATK